MKLVIVESPTKAKTIKKFLPKGYEVVASMGHLRDLPQSASDIPQKYKKEEWAKLGVDVAHDFEPLYVVPKGKSKIVRELKKLLKESDELYLATDEDREGESISWHLLQLLNPKVPVKRMVFHEITKSAIERALENPRELDMNLVKAQEARRILDRIYGYTLSPLLWKKISYGLSAGRVQSAGLRMIVERERERMRFISANYWDVDAIVHPNKDTDAVFEATLSHVKGTRIAQGKDFDGETGELKKKGEVTLVDESLAQEIATTVAKTDWKVSEVKEKKSNANPSAPFITSTLQQEANRKLGMSAREAMGVAQKLYEEGFITYMRTDSPNLSQEAIDGARAQVKELYGNEYLSSEARQFSSKSKNAQEAHEAIRPTGKEFKHPKDTGLSGDALKLYTLVWMRTLASQMKAAEKASMSIVMDVTDYTFTATGTRIIFPGFLRVYVEHHDNPEEALGEKEVVLPKLAKGDAITPQKAEAVSHETKPPARFNEASLVQALEKENIGRPSTYASIISTILDRGYVRKVQNALVPSFTGMAVMQLLESHFPKLVDYGFTSAMEDSLDDIAVEKLDGVKYLENFYHGPKGLENTVKETEKDIDPDESRTIHVPKIDSDTEVKVGKYGPYIIAQSDKGEDVHASIPEDIAPSDLKQEDIDVLIEQSKNGPTPIGADPKTGKNVYCLVGRYGAYVQLGEVTEEEPKPRRSSLPKPLTPQTLTLEGALKLLELPRELGMHPETGLPVIANLGRFGPYVGHDGDFRSIKKDEEMDVYTITLERALELLAEEKKGRGRSKMIKELGKHPSTNKKISLYDGKYGVYIKYGTKNVGLPDELKEDKEKAEKLTLEEAAKIIDEETSK